MMDSSPHMIASAINEQEAHRIGNATKLTSKGNYKVNLEEETYALSDQVWKNDRSTSRDKVVSQTPPPDTLVFYTDSGKDLSIYDFQGEIKCGKQIQRSNQRPNHAP